MSQKPYLYLLDASVEGVPHLALQYFTREFLRALSAVDTEKRVHAQLKGGLPCLSEHSQYISAVSNAAKTSSRTQSHDMGLYKLLLWDFADSLKSGWKSLDPDDAFDVVAKQTCECLAISDLPDDLPDTLDKRLRSVRGYVGAFALDPGNPIIRDAFYDSLMHFAVISGRALRNWALAAAAVLLLFSLNSRVQIGVRFLLPMIALGLLGLAAAAAAACRELGPGWRKRLLATGVVAGLGWSASASVGV